MMKETILFILIAVLTTSLYGQDNPYESLGIDVKVVTLSNGKYKEFFDDERIIQIGSIIYDIEEKRMIGIIKEDSIPNNFYVLPLSDSRWISPDPLADEFESVSPYNFSNNNPIRFTDPTGLAPEDIIIGNKSQEEQFQVLSQLRQLTNDELAIQSGKVVITSQGTANTGSNLSEGTQLISDLINDNNITNVSINTDLGNKTLAVNPVSKKEIRRGKPISGNEYDANVYIKGTDPTTVNMDGSTGVENGSFITLGHELQHARDLATGSYTDDVLPSVFDFDNKKIMTGNSNRPFTVREFKTRMFENKIRHEQGKVLRALPLPIISLSILKP